MEGGAAKAAPTGWNMVKLIRGLLRLDHFWAIFKYHSDKCKREAKFALSYLFIFSLCLLHGNSCNKLNPEKFTAIFPQFN